MGPDAAERAVQRRVEADRTRWWRSGRRERLTVEAARRTKPMTLAQQAVDLQQDLGGPQVWRLAREQAERTEARYPDARERRNTPRRPNWTRHTNAAPLRDRRRRHNSTVEPARAHAATS
jgi:hypothetical protein